MSLEEYKDLPFEEFKKKIIESQRKVKDDEDEEVIKPKTTSGHYDEQNFYDSQLKAEGMGRSWFNG